MNEQVRVSANGGAITIAAPVGHAEAAKAASTEQLKNNSGRRRAKPSPLQLRIAKENEFYIFNVGPFQIPRPMGSPGVYTIPACPEGHEYSPNPLVIPGLVFEEVIANEHSMKLLSDDGDYFADQVLGIGVNMKPNESPIHLGAFVSKTNPPAKEEAAKARDLFRAHCQREVNRVNEAYAIGPEKLREVKTEITVMMARLLGLNDTDCPWLKGTEAPAQRESCSGCGKPYVVGIERCACGRVLDRAKYLKSVEDGFYPGITLESLGIAKPTKPVAPPLKNN